MGVNIFSDAEKGGALFSWCMKFNCLCLYAILGIFLPVLESEILTMPQKRGGATSQRGVQNFGFVNVLKNPMEHRPIS